MKELVIKLRPSEMLYVSAMKHFLDSQVFMSGARSENRRLILKGIYLAIKSLENATYLGKARLALLLINLDLGSTPKYFKVYLEPEGYSAFWYIGERLGLEKKHDIFIGLLMLAEKERTVQKAVDNMIFKLVNKVEEDTELKQALESSSKHT